MSERFVDLHTHSNASDGTDSPAEVVRAAHAAGLSALALTDHDTVAGVVEARAEANRLGIEFLAGIEISCSYPRPGTMHLLGYGIDPDSTILQNKLNELVHARDTRNEKIVEILRGKGVPISMERVREIAAGGVVGRPHIAQAVIEAGFAKDTAQAFSRFLGNTGVAYVDKERLSPRQAIELIHAAGGIVSLAHPVQLRKQNRAQLREEIKRLADFGLDAVEVIHSDHSESVVDLLEDWCGRFNLLRSGGSDYHGTNKPHIRIGFAQRRRVPREFFDAILAKQAARSV